MESSNADLVNFSICLQCQRCGIDFNQVLMLHPELELNIFILWQTLNGDVHRVGLIDEYWHVGGGGCDLWFIYAVNWWDAGGYAEEGS